jgi:hypothetical protein
MLGSASFAVMRTLLIASMGEALSAPELEIFTQLTGRMTAPSGPAEELWIIAGRRSGKTIAIATIAAYLAGCCDHRDCLGPASAGCCRSWPPTRCRPRRKTGALSMAGAAGHPVNAADRCSMPVRRDNSGSAEVFSWRGGDEARTQDSRDDGADDCGDV